MLKASNREDLADAIAKAAQEYIESVAVYEQTTQKYTVKKGDTLSAIAKKYGVTVDAIVKANNIKNKNIIRVGTVLEIPVK